MMVPGKNIFARVGQWMLIYLFLTGISAHAQGKLEVLISIPQNSGVAFVRYEGFKITNDSLYVIDLGYMFFEKMRRDSVTARYPVSKAEMRNLKEQIGKIDSIGYQVNPCSAPFFGWPRFFISFQDGQRKGDGYIGDVYRENIYRVIDVFNTLYRKHVPDRDVIGYDRKKLLQDEKDCNTKRAKSAE